MSEPMQAFPRGPDYPGMTLRDYFAAQAMIGLLSNATYLDSTKPYSLTQVAVDSMWMADLLLSELEKAK